MPLQLVGWFVSTEWLDDNMSEMHIARQNIKLVDGRRLSYAVFGTRLDQTCSAVLYYHGWPSSAAEGAIWTDAAAAHGIFLIAVDRPGIGSSTYNPNGVDTFFCINY